MRGGVGIVPIKLVRGAPTIESDPLYPIIRSVYEKLNNYLNNKLYKETRFTKPLYRVLHELRKVSGTISFFMVRHFNLRLILSKLRFLVKDEFIRQLCTTLLECWNDIDDNKLPRNFRYCDHQMVGRDWYLGFLNATRIPTRPVPPYRPMAHPDRKAVYVDLWYEKHRLQIYGDLQKERFQEELTKESKKGQIGS